MNNLYEIINTIKHNVDLETFISKRKEECLKHISEDRRKIGVNRFGNARYGGITSSSNDFIDENRRISIQNGVGDIVEITTGNIDDAYLNLFNKIRQSPINNIQDILNIVYQTVNDYFGSDGDAVKRLELLPDLDIGTATLVDLKGKNLAACVERATLSQNLLKILGIDSTIKQSSIIYKEKDDCHAYNILRINNHFFLFDASLPVILESNSKNPIVGVLSSEEYTKIVNGDFNIGCKTKQMKNGVIYDSSFPTIDEQLNTHTKEQNNDMSR